MSHLPSLSCEDSPIIRNQPARVSQEITPSKIVRVTPQEMIAKFQNGNFNRMKLCVYNPASNTLRTVDQ